MMGRCEQPVDQPLVSIGRGVGLEGVDLSGGRGEADQVEADATDQGRAIGLGHGAQALGLQPGQHEMIDRVAGPRPVTHFRRWDARRQRVRPVALPLRPLRDPSAEERDLLRVQRLPELRRRHDLVGIAGGDAADQLAVIDPGGDDRRAALAIAERVFFPVEPQIGFPRLLVGPVAGVAVLGQDRPDLAVEVDGALARARVQPDAARTMRTIPRPSRRWTRSRCRMAASRAHCFNSGNSRSISSRMVRCRSCSSGVASRRIRRRIS